MPLVRVADVLHDRILVSRESARLLEGAFRASIAQRSSGDPFVIDFQGVAGVAPSFLDELITVLEEVTADSERRFELIVAHPPSRLSLKFEAIARGHRMSVRSLENGSWLLRAAG